MGRLPAKVGASKHGRAAIPCSQTPRRDARSPARRHGPAAAEGVAVQAAAGSKRIISGQLLVLQLGGVGAWPIAGIQPLQTTLSESPAQCGQRLLQECASRSCCGEPGVITHSARPAAAVPLPGQAMRHEAQATPHCCSNLKSSALPR